MMVVVYQGDCQQVNFPYSIDLVVFGLNTGDKTNSTLRKAKNASLKLGTEFQNVILVDDGSNIPLHSYLQPEVLEFITSIKRNDKPYGIGDAVKTALASCTSNYLMILPGHDLFTESSIATALKVYRGADLALGYRLNVAHERPLLKRIATRIFNILVRLKISPHILDAHGLPVYRTDVVRIAIKSGLGHGLHVQILRRFFSNNSSDSSSYPILVQLPTKIVKDSLKQVSLRSRFTKPKHVAQAMRSLFEF